MGEEIFVRLRDCFTAGYTFPQYCIDNGIKRPLFVSEKKFELFLWEIYVQFHYDKRLMPQFCFIDSNETSMWLPAYTSIILPLNIKNFSDMNPNVFDKIIFLTTEKPKEGGQKIIPLAELEKFFIRRTYVEIPLLKFLQRYPRVRLIVTNFPSVERYESRQTFNPRTWDDWTLIKTLRDRKSDDIETPLDRFGYTNQDIYEIMKAPPVKSNADGSAEMSDDNYPLLKIQNGKRATAYQPEHFRNRIYIFGTCHHYGICASFDKTIESYLQRLLNENELPYRVENEGQQYRSRYQDIFYNLNKLSPKPDDIIFIFLNNDKLNDSNIPFCDVGDAFDPPIDYKEIFTTRWHINELGYKLLAEKYFKFLTENNFFRDKNFDYPLPPPPYHRYGIPPQFEFGGVKNFDNPELEQYKQSLRAKRIPVGAIVMNCNPFTLGHQYLVEYAAAKVTRLYIFVVEEDRSAFPFKDRIELVRQGVKHIPNVEVLPSGKFIISQQTFSGYFNKAELQDVAVDSSEDVEIFAKEIAPTLGITIRFAGEEPTDNVTRQHNETMKKILPRYGIEFCEIPRKVFGEEIISASKVRAALQVGDFDKIKRLVPNSTFKYLRARQPGRVDIQLKPQGEGDFEIVSVSDEKAEILKPGWFNKDGIGYQIHSHAGKLEFIAKATANGQIRLYLRGVWFPYPKDTSKFVPYWIDYTKLIINDQIIFDKLTPVWHNKPFIYNLDVKADDEIKFQIEWLTYKEDE